MFKTLPQPDGTPRLRFRFEGREIAAREGDTLAAALLASGEAVFRESAVSGAPRGPYCMMGLCFDCLVEIDGQAGRQACMTEVAEAMVVRRQQRPGDAA